MSDYHKGNPPLFSIITVTYNAAQTIGPTLESVRSQTFDLYEHIIVDGASSDDTVKIAMKGATTRQLLFSDPDSGLYDAMNKGLARATGEYVVFLNAGDTFHSVNTLQQVADAAFANDFPGVIYGQTDIVGPDRRRLVGRHLVAPEVLTYNSFREGMVVCHQAFFAMRRLTSNFDLRFRYSADYEWCLRVLQHSRHNCYIDAVLADYLMEGQTTANRRKSLTERFRIMCYYFGFFPTLINHLKFIPRFLRRRKLEKSLTK